MVRLIDTSDAVARRTRHLCESLPARAAWPVAAATDAARLWTTGEQVRLESFARRWLDFAWLAEAATIPD